MRPNLESVLVSIFVRYLMDIDQFRTSLGANMGEVWLGLMPSEAKIEWLHEYCPVCLVQVCCTALELWQQTIDNWEGGSWTEQGCTMPDATLVKIEASHPQALIADFKKAIGF